MMKFSDKGICLNGKDFGISYFISRKLTRYTKEQELGKIIKKTMYQANTESFSAAKDFPYRAFLEKYCLPKSKNFLDDDKYYLVMDYQTPLVKEKAGRFIPNEELLLRQIKNKMPGSYIQYDPDTKAPYLFTEEGFKISCAPSKSTKQFARFPDEAQRSTAPFPRSIDIYDDYIFLMETAPEKYEAIDVKKEPPIGEIKDIIDRVLWKRKLNEERSQKPDKSE